MTPIRHVLVQRPDGTSQRLNLAGREVRIGRSTQDNDLSFPEDENLSRRHLVLERHEDRWRVRDLGAKNGTFLNGKRLDGPQDLRAGDRVAAGKITLVFDPPADEPSGGVVFYAEGDEPSSQATFMTRLDGLLSMETTSPGKKSGATPLERRLPLDHPGVAAIVRACQELPGHRPLPELFQLILDLSIEAVGGERGVLMTLEDERLTVQAVRGQEFRISTTVRDRVIENRESVLVRDTSLDDMFREQRSIVQQKIHTMMAAPLQTKDRVIGLIEVDSQSLVQRFENEDLELLTILANIAAIRIEQERLALIEVAERMLARELKQAASIQRRLLPAKAPEVPGFDLAGYNAACRTVGGDYYDFFVYPDGRLGFVVGDVAGKGMPAALLMTSLKGGVQVLAEVPDDLGRLVGRMNRVVSANFPPNRFVSLFFGVLDPRTTELTYCNAGHNPPLLCRAGGRAEMLEGGGGILGIMPDAAYEARRCRVDTGDVLVLYSDGVTEAESAQGEEFGVERLATVIQSEAGKSAKDLIARTTAEIGRFTGGAPAADDVTLVVIRRPGGPA